MNEVYEAIWMKYVFNLVALGSIKPRQTFIVSHVRASVIIFPQLKFHKSSTGGEKDICVQDKNAKSALNHLKRTWLTVLTQCACSLWCSRIFGIFSFRFCLYCFFFSTVRNQDHKSSTLSSLIWPQRSDAELKSLPSKTWRCSAAAISWAKTSSRTPARPVGYIPSVLVPHSACRAISHAADCWTCFFLHPLRKVNSVNTL